MLKIIYSYRDTQIPESLPVPQLARGDSFTAKRGEKFMLEISVRHLSWSSKGRKTVLRKRQDENESVAEQRIYKN